MSNPQSWYLTYTSTLPSKNSKIAVVAAMEEVVLKKEANDSDNSEDEHNDTQLAVDLYQDQSDAEVLLQPTQPTTTPPPAPEPPKCQICLVGPLNAVWMCGHFLCVDCAENIKNNQSRV